MNRRGKTENKNDEEDEEEEGNPVIFLSSSDDEEANMDLSLEIIVKASKRESKDETNDDSKGVNGKIERTDSVIDVSSSDGVEFVQGWGGSREGTSMEKRKNSKKKSKKKKKKEEIEEPEKTSSKSVLGIEMSELPPKTPQAADMEGVEITDNTVMQKLLRGPRYFNTMEENWLSCYNCGDSGHLAVNCPAEKRKKPCFVCGKFGHGAKSCTQGRECYICKKLGHAAKDCSEKHSRSPQTSKICLRCGCLGHDMSSCRNDYASDDLKDIQCYICQQFGHICCVDIIAGGPGELSCYNCGRSGHTGSGCATPRGDKTGKWEESGQGSQILCYRCGGEGHFARGCTQSAKRGEPSTPQSHSKDATEFWGFRSVPHDFHAIKKKKSMQYEGQTMTTWKSRLRGGWISDNREDPPDKNIKSNGWGSSSQSTKRGHKFSTSGSGQSPHKKHSFMKKTPGSYGSTQSYQQDRFSSPRFGNPWRQFGRTNGY